MTSLGPERAYSYTRSRNSVGKSMNLNGWTGRGGRGMAGGLWEAILINVE